MEVTVEEVSNLTRKLRIVLPENEVGKELDSAYRKLKSEVNLKGFRKGKIPRSVLEKNFGDHVRAEVGEKLVQASYFDAVEKEKLDPVVHPEVKSHSFEGDGTFIYEAEIDVRPQFELGEYKGLAIEKPAVSVSDTEIDEELERLRREMAPLRSVEGRAVQHNDVISLDFQGYDDGQPLKQVRGENASMDVGSGRNGKEFEEKLIGLQKGAEESFEVAFPPESSSPVLAGKNIEFKVKVNDIKERVMAALDDEFAKDLGKEYKTLAELKDSIRAQKLQEKEDALQGDLSDRIMLKLLDNNDFEVPARLVQYEIEDYIKQTEKTLERGGLNMEAAGINREELAERYRETAQKRVRGDFILKKISEAENIKVEEEDLNKGFGRIAAQYNMTIDQVKGYFKSRDDMLPFLNELLNEKILGFLLDAANFIPESTSSADDKAVDQSENGEDA